MTDEDGPTTDPPHHWVCVLCGRVAVWGELRSRLTFCDDAECKEDPKRKQLFGKWQRIGSFRRK